MEGGQHPLYGYACSACGRLSLCCWVGVALSVHHPRVDTALSLQCSGPHTRPAQPERVHSVHPIGRCVRGLARPPFWRGLSRPAHGLGCRPAGVLCCALLCSALLCCLCIRLSYTAALQLSPTTRTSAHRCAALDAAAFHNAPHRRPRSDRWPCAVGRCRTPRLAVARRSLTECGSCGDGADVEDERRSTCRASVQHAAEGGQRWRRCTIGRC